jgi:hypothetical protein
MSDCGAIVTLVRLEAVRGILVAAELRITLQWGPVTKYLRAVKPQLFHLPIQGQGLLHHRQLGFFFNQRPL